MNMMALAMNPNLSEQQFSDMAQKMMEQKNSLLKLAMDNMNTLETPEQQSQYLSAVLPILSMF